MRNKSELLCIGLVIIVVAGVFRFYQGARAGSRPSIGLTSFKIEKSWPSDDGRDKCSEWGDSYSFFVRGDASGATFEAVLVNGRKEARSTGRLPEAKCRDFFGGLESAGIRKLVSLPGLAYGRGCVTGRFDTEWEYVKISFQAGDWRNDVYRWHGQDQ